MGPLAFVAPIRGSDGFRQVEVKGRIFASKTKLMVLFAVLMRRDDATDFR